MTNNFGVLKKFWQYLSHIGSEANDLSVTARKNLILFNQVLAVGFIATVFQVVFVWPFIAEQALLFLIMCAGIIGAYWFNHKGWSWYSKRWFQLLTYLLGAATTLLLGGAGYYHLQAFLIFYLGLIMFDFRKEKFEILIGIPFIAFSIVTGELGLFGTPDFSDHELIHVVRFANLFSLLLFSSIFTFFLIRQNRSSEQKLTTNILEKEMLLERLVEQSKELTEGNSRLEEAVVMRTAEINAQKETLLVQNKEKELLLKEVHHRVQNNLQIIISLINLQRLKFDNQEIEMALKETQNRVHSMSLVHKRMYQSSDFTSIGLKPYVDQIIENISALYGMEKYSAKIDIPEAIEMDVERAIPIGLIINEAITNFFKHAYDSSCDQFEISATSNGSGVLSLIYKDNGAGFPKGLNINDDSSIGLQLIDSLATQLDGTFTFYNENGAIYDLKLSID